MDHLESTSEVTLLDSGPPRQFKLSGAKHYLQKSLDDLQKTLKTKLSNHYNWIDRLYRHKLHCGCFQRHFSARKRWNDLPEPVVAVAFIVEATEVPNPKVDGKVSACHHFQVRISPVNSG